LACTSVVIGLSSFCFHFGISGGPGHRSTRRRPPPRVADAWPLPCSGPRPSQELTAWPLTGPRRPVTAPSSLPGPGRAGRTRPGPGERLEQHPGPGPLIVRPEGGRPRGERRRAGSGAERDAHAGSRPTIDAVGGRSGNQVPARSGGTGHSDAPPHPPLPSWKSLLPHPARRGSGRRLSGWRKNQRIPFPAWGSSANRRRTWRWAWGTTWPEAA
jgi:hypothetical protein